MSDDFMKIVEHVQKTGKGPENPTAYIENAEWTNNDALNKLFEHDQSILYSPYIGDPPPGILPQVGDWPPAPTPCDPIGTPNQLNYGWICPKCGRCLAPHVDSCPYCSEPTTINITY